MTLRCLGSSSSGNCYLFIADNGESLILECGVPMHEIKKGLDWQIGNVAGCLVSHKHKDHSLCLQEMASLGIKVYSHREVFDYLPCFYCDAFYVELEPKQWKNIGSFKVLPFPVLHANGDGNWCKCFGYVIHHAEMGMVLFTTDAISLPCKFKGLRHILIEANYSDKILAENIASGLETASRRERLMHSHMEIGTTIKSLEGICSDVSEIILIHLSNTNSDAAEFCRMVVEATGIPTYAASKGFEANLSITTPY